MLLSQDEFEYTTDLLYDWISHLGGNVIRVNGIELLNKSEFSIDFDSTKKKLIFKNLKIDEINVIWYRRWLGKYVFSKNADENIFLKKEFRSLSQYFFSCFPSNRWHNFDSYQYDYASKSKQLHQACKVGFKIPDSLITNSKEQLINFVKRNSSVIMKPIGDIETFYDKKKHKSFAPFTERVNLNDIENFDTYFFPTLFQKEIKKKFELRVFFDKGDIFSMAIFSSTNLETEIDFRQYDDKKPNRNVPYQLNKEVEGMITKFMKAVNLQTGSLDLIFSENNEIYFLEVNPLGQFGMVSSPCNYYIEKKLAEKLIKIDNEK
ncbi:grasp-with-spasm system ATP-grasp peptide maturase [Cloacibacterium normanense]